MIELTGSEKERRDKQAITMLRRIGKGWLVRRYPANSIYHGYLSPRAKGWLEMAGNRIIEAPGGYLLNPEGQQRVGVV